MCDSGSTASEAPKSLHEKFCRLTHGIPCRTVHAIMALILGRKANDGGCGCGGHEDGSTCGCGGHGKDKEAAATSKGGCGCGSQH